jgi:hypothetical protein
MKNKYDMARPNIPAALERSIKVESGHSCGIKGCLEHTYIEIHHIDGNRENNNFENLIFLCDKHHKMAHAGVIDRKALREYKKLLTDNNNFGSVMPDARSPTSEASLHIVDIYEVEDESYDAEFQCTLVEVKFRNSGSEVAFLKEMIFVTRNHWDINTDRHHRLVDVSAHYDVKVFNKPGAKCSIKIHHEIKPQDVDRIRFRMTTDYCSDPDGLSLYLLDAKVLYNEDSYLELNTPIVVNIKPLIESAGSFFQSYSSATITNNKAVAIEVMSLHRNGTNIADYILGALGSWDRAPSAKEYNKNVEENP